MLEKDTYSYEGVEKLDENSELDYQEEVEAERAAANHEGKNAWSARLSSPCCEASCFLAVLAALCMLAVIVLAFQARGDLPLVYALTGMLSFPLSMLGVWLGLHGRQDRQEKKQLTGLAGVIANLLLFVCAAAVYGMGIF